jgi:hypothetical protein
MNEHEPWTFSRNEQTFTFDNGQVKFDVTTNIDTPLPVEPVIVESVALTTPGSDVVLGIHDLLVPPPVVEHLESHFTPPDLLLHI